MNAPLPSEDDAVIVARILAGEHTLFERLVRRYNQRLYRAARALLGNDAEAEDVVQQGWMSIYRALGQWRGAGPASAGPAHLERSAGCCQGVATQQVGTGRGSFSGWALAIVTNTCLKQRGRMSNEAIDDSDPDETTSSLPGPDEETHRHQLREVLSRNVDALPVKLRTVLVLCDVEGMTGPEVSEALGVSEEAVRVRLHRARRSLQSTLEAQLAGEGKELFSFMGARCDKMTAAVLHALHIQRGVEGDA